MTTTLIPTIRCSEPATIEWIASVFATPITERTPTDDGRGIAHAQLWFDGQCLMVSTVGQIAIPTGGSSIYLAYDSEDAVEALFARAIDAGAQVEMAPQQMSYGGINTSFRDPDGNLWSVGTYLPAAPAAA